MSDGVEPYWNTGQRVTITVSGAGRERPLGTDSQEQEPAPGSLAFSLDLNLRNFYRVFVLQGPGHLRLNFFAWLYIHSF